MANPKEKRAQSFASEQAPQNESRLLESGSGETAPIESLARKSLEIMGAPAQAERGSIFFANHDIQPSDHREQKSVIRRAVSAAPVGVLAGYLVNTIAFVQIANFVFGAYHGFNKTPFFSAFLGKAALAGAFVGLSLALFSAFVFPPAYIVSAIAGTTLTPIAASALLGVVTTAASSLWWCAGRVIRAGVDLLVG